MKHTPLVLCLVLSLFMLACESEPVEEAKEETAVVDLASDGVLEASFMSDHRTFSYRFEYDGAVVQMMEGEGALVGPQFVAQGGAVIRGKTVWLSEIVEQTDRAGTPIQLGAYQVYRYMDSQGSCALHEAIVPYGEEALMLSMSVCEGQDGDQGRLALDTLLEGLSIQAQ